MTAQHPNDLTPGHALYVAWGFPPAKSGGVFRMMETANALVELGWRVTVLACDIDDLRRYAGVDMTTLQGVNPAIEVVRVPFELGAAETDLHRWDELRAVDPAAWRKQFQARLAAAFPNSTYGLWEQPLWDAAQAVHAQHPIDVTLASGGPFVTYSVGRRLQRAHGVPYILDYRDSWSLQQFTDERIFDRGSAVTRVEADLVAHASEVWFVNDAMRVWHEDVYPAITGRTRVVTNGYDREVLEGLAVPMRRDQVRFAFLGTCTPSVPLRECLDGYTTARGNDPAMGDSVLEFHGYLGFYPTPDRHLAAEIARASSSGVSYHGPVPKADVGAVYGRADALVLTFGGSKYITSGKVFEYMATGRPIVSVHGPENAVRDVLADYPLWFAASSLEPEDVADAFARAAAAVRSGVASDPAVVERALAHARRYERRGVLKEAMADLPSLVHRAKAFDRLLPSSPSERPAINVYEMPVPSTRTVRMADTLRAAGVEMRSVHNADEDVVRALGFVSTPFRNRRFALFSKINAAAKTLALAEPGTVDGRMRDVHRAMLEIPVPATRPIWNDTNILSQDWYDAARLMVEKPTPILWAADLDALPPVIWAKHALPGTRVIFDAHELFSLVDYLDPTQVEEWEEIARTFIPEVDLVITVGEGIADELRRRYGAKRVEVIESLAVPTRFPGEDVRSSLGLGADVPLAIHIGNVSANRNPLLAVELLVSMPELHFAFVGTVRGNLHDLLDEAAADRGVRDRLHFTGNVGRGQLQHFLTTADVAAILYSPDTSENLRLAMPNKLFDALSAGLPGVATAGTAAAEYLEREGLGQAFVDGDAESLASAIRAVLGDERMRGNAANSAESAVWAATEPRLLEMVAAEYAAAQVPPLRAARGPRLASPVVTAGTKTARRKPRYSWRKEPRQRAKAALAWRLRKLLLRLERK
ncbi:glycosyltransferase [Pseudactinotalea suaedae]|uniref:glycosyltransferase n=1 Tax=Pseudactinotalea suaedae TaxID=1524924 RepID=UPI0012E13D20|nr:glycosyltransferase [Pseudactinotalea suaedae]